MIAKVKVFEEKTEITKYVLRELISKGLIENLPSEPEITQAFINTKYPSDSDDFTFYTEGDSIVFDCQFFNFDNRKNKSEVIVDEVSEVFYKQKNATVKAILTGRGGEVK